MVKAAASCASLNIAFLTDPGSIHPLSSLSLALAQKVCLIYCALCVGHFSAVFKQLEFKPVSLKQKCFNRADT